MTNARWQTLVGLAVVAITGFLLLHRFDAVINDRGLSVRLDRWTGAIERVTPGGLPALWSPAAAASVLGVVGGAALLLVGVLLVVRRIARDRSPWLRWLVWSRTSRGIVVYTGLIVIVAVEVSLLLALRTRDRRLEVIQRACTPLADAIVDASASQTYRDNNGRDAFLVKKWRGSDAVFCRDALTPSAALDLTGVPRADAGR